uniref:Uncharacterized protein n=1 Tax=Meloidogyne enterolobii TaxID=390850 RepID=A0A6V7V8P5_MELEN|nr:unnamed protein product [Meloidogyne enterolobii]
MHPGEGPSGSKSGRRNFGEGSRSQQPVELDASTQLNNAILRMLEKVGDSHPFVDQTRPLQNNEHARPYRNVGEQYVNSVCLHNEFLEKAYKDNQLLIRNYERRKEYLNNHRSIYHIDLAIKFYGSRLMRTVNDETSY